MKSNTTETDWLAEQLFWQPKRFQVEFAPKESDSTWKMVTKRLQCSTRLTVSTGSHEAARRHLEMRRGNIANTNDSVKEFGVAENFSQSGTLEQRLFATCSN